MSCGDPMRMMHISAIALLGLSALSAWIAGLPALAIPLLMGMTYAKVMLVLLVFAELQDVARSWQVTFGLFFAVLIGILATLQVIGSSLA